MDEARKLLVETRVKQLSLSSSSLVQLLDTSTVGQALQVLAENRILSAPVIAPGDDHGLADGVTWPAQLPNSDVMGFVCVNDILTSFLECYTREFGEVEGCGPRSGSNGQGAASEANGKHAAAPAGPGNGSGVSMLARMRQLEAMGQRFAQQQLRHLTCKGCDGDFLHSRHAGEATLLELVMYGFLDPKRRGMHEGEQQSRVVHRVALFDSTGRVTCVISQSDICRFLEAHLGQLGALAGATVEELGWGSKAVVSCTPETPALEAMRLMVAAGVSSLAVVAAGPDTVAAAEAEEEEGSTREGARPGVGGRLLGNFSASEMRTMTAEHFGALSLPVGEFLALENETEYVAVNRQRLLSEEGLLGSPAHNFIRNRLRRVRPHAPGEEVGQRLVVASPASTFAEVVGMLVRHCIHRVYVVDEREVPVGIVTCTDILRKVVEVATEAAPPSPSRAH